MAQLRPCIEKIELPQKLKDYIISQREVHAKKGLSEKQADLLTAKELQEKTLDELHNVYNKLGVKGYENAIEPKAELPETKIPNPTEKESHPNEPPIETGETAAVDKEFEKMTTSIPNGGEVKKYLSGDTIKKYEENAELRNNQEIIAQELEPALKHGVETIDKAKEVFGEQYVEKTLDYIEREKLNPENKALLYVSLENDMANRILAEPDNAQLKKLQDLVRTKSQAYLRSNSLAINMGRLRKFAEIGYDMSKLTEGFFSTKEMEQRGQVEKLLQADAETINKEAEAFETEGGMTPFVEQKIKEGVEKEINSIYEKMPKPKRDAANKAIKALENIQKKLRNKTYDASIGVPVAILDAGITTIKNAIKLGVNIADAIELGINKIKEKYGKEWAKEKDFREDMLKGFKDSGYKEEAKLNPKKYTKEVLIKEGFGREVTVTTKNGKEKRMIVDWKKLAGEEGSVDKISENVANALKEDVKSGKLTEEEVTALKDDFIEEYNNIRASVIEKGLNEMARRNNTTVSPTQKSAAKKLSEMYNYGLFDKDPVQYETTLARTIGIDKLNEGRVAKVMELGKAMAELYSTKFQGKRLTESQMRSAIQVVEEKMRELLHAEANQHGSTFLKIADFARTYMDASQRMTLNNLKQAFENPLSGLWENLYSSVGYTIGMPKELKAQRAKMARQLYKEMILERGIGYGNVSSTFVNKGNLDMVINKMSDNQIFQALSSTALGKSTLDAVDSFFKAKITQQKFAYNLVQILTKDRTVNGKVEKGMSKEDAKKYVAEKLTGQSFKDAQATAKKIIDKANAGQEKKIFNDSPLFVDRLANDIVTASLVNGEKITEEMVTAAYNAAYKAAGRGLGHVSNNFISQGVGTTTGKIESNINEAIKEKDYNKAAVLTLLSIFFRNIANPFVGGGTNWVVLKAEKTGLGLVSGLGSMMMKGKKMDLTSESGIKQLEKAMYENLKVKDKFIRGAIGGATTALTALAFAGITSTDEYRKWRNKNMWAARYLDVLTPETILAVMAAKDDKMKRYLESTLNQNEQFDKTKKLVKGATAAVKGDFQTAKGQLGEVAGGIVGFPVPWRLVRDGQQIVQGVSGDNPYKVDNSPSQSIFEGYFKGGLLDYLGATPKPEYLGRDLSVPEWKFLKDNGLDIKAKLKNSLKPIDEEGNLKEVTDEDYRKFLEEREKLIKEETSLAMKGELIAWNVGGIKKKFDKLTDKEKESWIMRVSNSATDQAIESVFGDQSAPKDKVPKYETIKP